MPDGLVMFLQYQEIILGKTRCSTKHHDENE